MGTSKNYPTVIAREERLKQSHSKTDCFPLVSLGVAMTVLGVFRGSKMLRIFSAYQLMNFITNVTNRLCILLVIFVTDLFISNQYSFSQDIHFAQLGETPLVLNPALTGLYNGYHRGILNYRNQWPAMGKPYNTFMGSFDMPIERKRKKLETKDNNGRLGVGLNFFSDKAGDSQFGTTEGNLSVSGMVSLDIHNTLSVGMQFGYTQKSVNVSLIKWPNQYNGQSYDPSITSNEQSVKPFSFFDMGTGINYEFSKIHETIDGWEILRFDAGTAFFHANGAKQRLYQSSSDQLYGKLIFNTSARIDIPGTLAGIVPSAIYMFQGPASELNVGALLRYKINQGTKVTGFFSQSAISFGGHYRMNDAVSPQVFLEFSDYNIGFSYDVNISSLHKTLKSTGGLEISLKYAKMRGAARKGMSGF